MDYYQRTNRKPPDSWTQVGTEKIGEHPVYLTPEGKFTVWLNDKWLSRATIAALRREAASRATPTTVMAVRGLSGYQHRRPERWDPERGIYVRDPNAVPGPFDRLDLARWERHKWTLANGNRIHQSGDFYAVDEALEAALHELIREQWALEDRWRDLLYRKGRAVTRDENGAPSFQEPEQVLDAARAARRAMLGTPPIRP